MNKQINKTHICVQIISARTGSRKCMPRETVSVLTNCIRFKELTSSKTKLREGTTNIGALIIRTGFWGPLYFSCDEELYQNRIGNTARPPPPLSNRILQAFLACAGLRPLLRFKTQTHEGEGLKTNATNIKATAASKMVRVPVLIAAASCRIHAFGQSCNFNQSVSFRAWSSLNSDPTNPRNVNP